MSPKLTLSACLEVASGHWSGASHSIMVIRCRVCMEAFKGDPVASSLGPADGVKLLAYLRASHKGARQLSPKSVADYYATFRRMLALAGVQTTTWPKAPKPPRVKKREPVPDDAFPKALAMLRARGWDDTADFACVLRGTGMRAYYEALREGAHDFAPPTEGVPYGVLTVRGKGGHERTIPVVDPEALRVLTCGDVRWKQTRYQAHLRRWNLVMEHLGVSSKLPTLHALRHAYLTEALKKSNNVALVAELAGHSDPRTTMQYLGLDMASKAGALSGV